MRGHSGHDRVVTARDVARIRNVRVNTVRRWSNQGILKAYPISSRGDRRFHGADIASFLLRESKIAGGRELGSTFERPNSTDGNKLVADGKNRYNP